MSQLTVFYPGVRGGSQRVHLTSNTFPSQRAFIDHLTSRLSANDGGTIHIPQDVVIQLYDDSVDAYVPLTDYTKLPATGNVKLRTRATGVDPFDVVASHLTAQKKDKKARSRLPLAMQGKDDSFSRPYSAESNTSFMSGISSSLNPTGDPKPELLAALQHFYSHHVHVVSLLSSKCSVQTEISGDELKACTHVPVPELAAMQHAIMNGLEKFETARDVITSLDGTIESASQMALQHGKGSRSHADPQLQRLQVALKEYELKTQRQAGEIQVLQMQLARATGGLQVAENNFRMSKDALEKQIAEANETIDWYKRAMEREKNQRQWAIEEEAANDQRRAEIEERDKAYSKATRQQKISDKVLELGSDMDQIMGVAPPPPPQPKVHVQCLYTTRQPLSNAPFSAYGAVTDRPTATSMIPSDPSIQRKRVGKVVRRMRLLTLPFTIEELRPVDPMSTVEVEQLKASLREIGFGVEGLRYMQNGVTYVMDCKKTLRQMLLDIEASGDKVVLHCFDADTIPETSSNATMFSDEADAAFLATSEIATALQLTAASMTETEEGTAEEEDTGAALTPKPDVTMVQRAVISSRERGDSSRAQKKARRFMKGFQEYTPGPTVDAMTRDDSVTEKIRVQFDKIKALEEKEKKDAFAPKNKDRVLKTVVEDFYAGPHFDSMGVPNWDAKVRRLVQNFAEEGQPLTGGKVKKRKKSVSILDIAEVEDSDDPLLYLTFRQFCIFSLQLNKML